MDKAIHLFVTLMVICLALIGCGGDEVAVNPNTADAGVVEEEHPRIVSFEAWEDTISETSAELVFVIDQPAYYVVQVMVGGNYSSSFTGEYPVAGWPQTVLVTGRESDKGYSVTLTIYKVKPEAKTDPADDFAFTTFKTLPKKVVIENKTMYVCADGSQVDQVSQCPIGPVEYPAPPQLNRIWETATKHGANIIYGLDRPGHVVVETSRTAPPTATWTRTGMYIDTGGNMGTGYDTGTVNIWGYETNGDHFYYRISAWMESESHVSYAYGEVWTLLAETPGDSTGPTVNVLGMRSWWSGDYIEVLFNEYIDPATSCLYIMANGVPQSRCGGYLFEYNTQTNRYIYGFSIPEWLTSFEYYIEGVDLAGNKTVSPTMQYTRP